MIVRYLLSTSLLIWLLIESIGGYSHGGPTKSCQTLIPNHGVDKQYGIASYAIRATQGPTGNIIVSIVSESIPFAGFMLQSRLTNDREKIVNGRFSEDKDSQTRNCNEDIPNTLTHRSGTPKYKIETSWIPPRSFVGSVVFRATIVQSKSVFWTALDSEPIQITSNLQKPNIAYNKNNAQDYESNGKQLDNIQSSSVPQTQSSTESQSRINYDICDKKFCFGLPNNCVKYRSCVMLLSGGYASLNDGIVEFEIYADVNKHNGNAYYSMGLSTDNKMGDDSVTDCLVNEGQPQITNSINIGKSNELLADNEFHGVTPLNTSYTNGILYCKWRRRRRSTIRGKQFDLRDKKYYIFVAFGSLSENDDKEIHTDKLTSEDVVDIRYIGHIAAYSKLFLIKLHGSFMIISWLGCVSIGIFMARYYKNIWQSQLFCGVKLWFAVHRSLMLFSLILILISSISVYIYVGTFIAGPHQLFGLLSILIAVFNPIGAAFRPNPDAPKRWIFNWIHWLCGNIGHVSAFAALFLAYNLNVNQLSPIYLWILIFYLLFHITSHLLLQLYSCNCRNSRKTFDISMGDMNNANKDNNQEIQNTTEDSFVRYYLIAYVIVIVSLVISLIVCISIPQSSNNSDKNTLQ